MNLITKEKAVLCSVSNPTPIAYFNIYEQGDIWIRIKGCEDCSWENRKKCCGDCPMLTEKGCLLHLENKGFKKPFGCVTRPLPSVCHSWCSLEFKCIRGSKKGKIRKVKEPGNVFR